MHGRLSIVSLSVMLLLLAAIAWTSVRTGWQSTSSQQVRKPDSSWSGGKYNPVDERGVEFTIPGISDLPDFHGNPQSARLVVFAEGNYFFALAELVGRFTDVHPDLRGKVFYETLPGVILTGQLKSGNTITVGNLTLHIAPDIFQAGPERLRELIGERLLEGPTVRLFRNRLAIMVAKGNPKGIRGLVDLARPGVRIANPNPATEGIAGQIKEALEKAGGKTLYETLYKQKVDNGEATVTTLHHRQTPLWILNGEKDAGIVWITEAMFQKRSGNSVDFVEIASTENVEGEGAAARVKNAPHGREANLWLEFLQSDDAAKVFQDYGFEIVRQAGAR